MEVSDQSNFLPVDLGGRRRAWILPIPVSASIRAWLSLLRPPNFLTLPGDVLAGYLLAAGAFGVATGELLLALLASVLFYGSGLLWNDWADAAIDRAERPDRPIPSGQVRRRTVGFVAAIAMGAAWATSVAAGMETAVIGTLLALAILNYNLLTKSLPIVGPFNMGMCRGLHLLLGATVIVRVGDLPPLVLWGAGLLVFYITAVTNLAAREMAPDYRRPERWLPALVVAAGFFCYLPLSPLVYWPGQVGFALCAFWAGWVCSRAACRLPRPIKEGGTRLVGTPVPAIIGSLLGVLPVLQAAMVFGAGDGRAIWTCALALLVLSPLQKLLRRTFYAS